MGGGGGADESIALSAYEPHDGPVAEIQNGIQIKILQTVSCVRIYPLKGKGVLFIIQDHLMEFKSAVANY